MAEAMLSLGLPFFVLLGIMVGGLGTLVGAGGGFILVPVLVFLSPEEPADRVTAISMAVVCANAFSGTLAYAAMRRIDYASGWRFAAAALPGAFLGAYATQFISRHSFEMILGLTLVLIAALLVRRSLQPPGTHATMAGVKTEGEFQVDVRARRLGAAISSVVGFVSSILGIGGGIVHVPALVFLLRYPIHVAIATSHFVLACTSFVAVVEHMVQGSYLGNVEKTAALAVGAVLGAQGGARLSGRVRGPVIVRCLALAMVLVGVRIICGICGPR